MTFIFRVEFDLTIFDAKMETPFLKHQLKFLISDPRNASHVLFLQHYSSMHCKHYCILSFADSTLLVSKPWSAYSSLHFMHKC